MKRRLRDGFARGVRAAIGLGIALAAANAANAASAAAPFGYYILSLSWSPSFCADAAGRRDSMQCGPDRHFAFIVHGLWPQSEAGRLENCRSDEPARVPARLGRSLFDIMPSMGLIGHEWRTHGTCSGLSQADYFGALRQARERVVIPKEFGDLKRPALAPSAIESAFVMANPGLAQSGITVTCTHARLQEVRICLTRDLAFRPCPRIEATACPLPRVSVPPPR